MPLQPSLQGDNVMDQWAEEVTYELNNIEELALAAGAGAGTGTGGGGSGIGVDEELIPIYATSADGLNQSTELGDRMFVYYLAVPVGEEPMLPLTGVTFIQFRGQQSRMVEITVKLAPTDFVNAFGVERDYTDHDTLATDFAIGAMELQNLPDDPDGFDFSYRAEVKILVARVAIASQGLDPDEAYEPASASRAFDYTWTRNGVAFEPVYPDATPDTAFLYLTAADTIDTEFNDGISAQFFCNIVQL